MTNRIPTIDRWAAELRAQGYAPHSITSMTSAPRLAAEHNQVEAHELTRDDVLDWIGRTTRATNTRLKYLSWIRAWCRWAGLPDLTEGIRRPAIPEAIPKPVGEGDLQAMLSVAHPGRERAWLVLGAYSGLRAHESAKVELEDLEAVGRGEHNLRVLGKGGQLGVVPAPPIVVEAVLEAAELADVTSGRIWPGASSQAVQHVVRRIGRRVGVDCTSHQLRHRYGTAFYQAERDLLMTAQVMRHKKVTTTQGYAKVAGDRVQAVARSLPGAAGSAAVPGRPTLRVIPGGAS